MEVGDTEQKDSPGEESESDEEVSNAGSPSAVSPDEKEAQEEEPYIPIKTRSGRKRKKLSVSESKEGRKEVDRFTYYQHIKYYIRESAYPIPRMTYGEKRVLRKAAKAYTLDGDTLYYRHFGSEKRIIESQDEIIKIISANHMEPGTDKHYGQCMTLKKISEKYHWRHMKQDVDNFIRECAACQERLMITAAWMERRKSAMEYIVQRDQGEDQGAADQTQQDLEAKYKSKVRKKDNSEGETNEDVGREVDRFWFYQQIKYYLWAARYLDPAITMTEKRVIRKASQSYTLGEGNSLYYRHKGINKKILESEDEVMQVVSSHHIDPASEKHFGQCGTLSKISQKFFWKHMKNDVDTYIRNCEVCKSRPTVIAQSSFVVKSSKPLELVVLDVLGPFPPTLTGYKYVCTLTDHYTKWVEFYPLKEKCHIQVAAAVKSFFYRFGAPGKLVSELEEQFVFQVNNLVGYKYRIKSNIIPEPATQYRGLDQKTLRFIKNKLSTLFKEHDTDWDQHLDEAAYLVRTQKALPTRKHNPYFLMFGREPHSIAEVTEVEERVAQPAVVHQQYSHAQANHQYNHQGPVTNNIAVNFNHHGHLSTPLNHPHHVTNTFSRPQINNLNEEVLATEMISVIYEMS